MRDPDSLLSPRFILAFSMTAGFFGAFAHAPNNETMIGALISGLNLALGYWLGSSNNATKSADNLGKSLDAAAVIASTAKTAADTAAVAAGVAPTDPKADIQLAPGQTAQAPAASPTQPQE